MRARCFASIIPLLVVAGCSSDLPQDPPDETASAASALTACAPNESCTSWNPNTGCTSCVPKAACTPRTSPASDECGSSSPPGPCTGGTQCIMQGDGVRRCVNPASGNISIYDEIRTEASKLSSDPERPLPLVSLFCSGPVSSANRIIRRAKGMYFPSGGTGSMELGEQMDMIAQKHHLLPTVETGIPVDQNNVDMTVSNLTGLQGADWIFAISGDSTLTEERDLLTSLMETGSVTVNNPLGAGPIQRLASNNLPLSIVLCDFEDMASKLNGPYWTSAVRNDLYYCPKYPSASPDRADGCFLSPFADPNHFKQMGRELARKNLVEYFRGKHPTLPSLVFVHNNESVRASNWLDAMADPRATALPPAGAGLAALAYNYGDIRYPGDPSGKNDPNAAQKEYIDLLWRQLYDNFQAGFSDELAVYKVRDDTQDAHCDEWTRARTWHIAYNSRPISFEDTTYNTVFKPDLYTYQECCADVRFSTPNADPSLNAIDYTTCKGQLPTGPADTNTAHSRACYHSQTGKVGPGLGTTQYVRCYNNNDQNFVDCKKPTWPRAEFTGTGSPLKFEEILNIAFEPATGQSGVKYYSTNTADQQKLKRAYHFLDDSWPTTSSGPKLDKWYRMMDGVLGHPGISTTSVDYMTAAYMLSAGFSSLALDGGIGGNFWSELNSYHTSDAISNLVTQGAAGVDAAYPHLTEARALGKSQLALWMNRPRVVRNFDSCVGNANFKEYGEKFFKADMAAVDHVWAEPALQSFWRDSALVENVDYTNLMLDKGVVRPFHLNEYGLPGRFWLLKTSAERSAFTCWRDGNPACGYKSNDVHTDVFAIARKQGGTTPPRYMVYAFTQKAETQNQVVITVPDPDSSSTPPAKFDITVDVPQSGAFFIFDGPAKEETPVLTSLSRSLVDTDDTSFTVTGTHFNVTTKVKVNGRATPTSYISSTHVKAWLPSLHATPGNNTVTVFNGAGSESSLESATLTVRARSCYDLKVREAYRAPGMPTASNSVIQIDPDGSEQGSQLPFDVHCMQGTDGGGWTLIASQDPSVSPTGNLRDHYNKAPNASGDSASEYYLKMDLRKPGMEFRVHNSLGDAKNFLADQFNGPLLFDTGSAVDSKNYVDASNLRTCGVIYGGKSPYVEDYQVARQLGSSNFRQECGSNTTYSNGLAIVFDWNDNDLAVSGSSPDQHAHFGGNTAMEASAARGTALYIRSPNLESLGARKSCKAHYEAQQKLGINPPSALYLLDPDETPQTAPFLAWCDMTNGGWTLIAAQHELFIENMALVQDTPTTQAGTNGVLNYYMTHDLKKQATEIKVLNAAGETHTFNTADFSNIGDASDPTSTMLVFNPSSMLNFVDAADNQTRGAIYGGNYPFVPNYNTWNTVTSANFRKPATVNATFSRGFAIIFDWNDGDGSMTADPSKHAHFGGTSALETYANRGTLLYIR